MLSRLVVSISMTAASIAELARSCRRRQVLDRGCPFIAETAADRMAGGGGSPVTPTFLAGSGVYFPVATQRTQRSPFLIVGSSGIFTSVILRGTMLDEEQYRDDPLHTTQSEPLHTMQL